MSWKQIAALITVILYLGGLGGWILDVGTIAWIVGLIFGIFWLITCLTSKEGSTAFLLSLTLSVSSLVYLVLGGVIMFFDLRTLFG